MKEKILVSACLLGVACRYDGQSNRLPELKRLQELAELVPFCAEVYGGLPTPRVPAEIRGGRVFAKDGQEVTEQFEKGASEALKLARLLGCRAAVLKERSPSCGSHQIYDGTFSGVRINGQGKTAGLLMRNGIRLFCEDEIDACIGWIHEQERAEERETEK